MTNTVYFHSTIRDDESVVSATEDEETPPPSKRYTHQQDDNNHALEYSISKEFISFNEFKPATRSSHNDEDEIRVFKKHKLALVGSKRFLKSVNPGSKLYQAGMQIMKPNNEEVASSGLSGRNSDLFVKIPPRPVGFGGIPSGRGSLPRQDSLKGNSTPGRFMQSSSFKNMAVVHDGEGSSVLNSATKEIPESPILANIISSWKKCVPLPVTPASMFSPFVSTPTENMCEEQQTSNRTAAPHRVSRSMSVPLRNVVIVRSESIRKEPVQTHTDQINHDNMEDDEEIPEEEAVCRICFDSLLCEEGNAFKLECSSKRDLMLTHEACVIKWFIIKGNKYCDVCGQEVRILPVTVMWGRSPARRDHRQGQNRQNPPQTLCDRHAVVVLVLISSICYFLILEQLLILKMKYQALLLAAPFGLTLGFLGSMAAIVFAMKEYIWTYAALEFALVALNLHLFYAVLHLSAIYSIWISAVLGFGIALSINSLLIYICARRVRSAEADVDHRSGYMFKKKVRMKLDYGKPKQSVVGSAGGQGNRKVRTLSKNGSGPIFYWKRRSEHNSNVIGLERILAEF